MGVNRDLLYRELEEKYGPEAVKAAEEAYRGGVDRSLSQDERSGRMAMMAGLQRGADMMGSIGGVTPKTDTSYLDQSSERMARRSDRTFDHAESERKNSEAERKNALYKHLELKYSDEKDADRFAREDRLREEDVKRTEEREKRAAAARAKERDQDYQRGLEKEERAHGRAVELKKIEGENKRREAEGKLLSAKPSGDQFKAATFGRRAEQAEDAFKSLEQSGFKRTGLDTSLQATVYPEAMKSSDLKSQEQAERNFINAILRRESGASISPAEFASAEKQYFPRAGDTPDVLTQKAANRQQVIAGLRAEAGNAWEQVPKVEIATVKKQKPGTAYASPGAGKAPEEMSDEELDAELKALEGR